MNTPRATKIAIISLFVALMASGCRPTPGKPALPPTIGQPPIAATGAPVRPPVNATPSAAQAASAGAPSLMAEPTPDAAHHPTLADLWEGRAHFAVDVVETGLPMGESDTLVMSNGALWS
ncbi:MAG: hypothetical protein ACK4SA_17295, partial [Caldilinea sp.]